MGQVGDSVGGSFQLILEGLSDWTGLKKVWYRWGIGAR